MFSKHIYFKFLAFSFIATFYQTNAADSVIQTVVQPSANSFFDAPSVDVVSFCKQKLEEASVNSSEQIFTDTFTSDSERAAILKQVGLEVQASALDHEAQVEQLFKTNVTALATRNFIAQLNEYFMSSRKLSQSNSPNEKADPLKSIKTSGLKQVLDDLRILSGNKGSSLFSVVEKLVGKDGMAPVSTTAGFAAATYALVNPITDKEKLEKRRKMLLQLVANPAFVIRLRAQLNGYAQARKLSFDRMLNPILPEPFDEKKHGTRDNHEILASKIVNFSQYQNFDEGLSQTLPLVLRIYLMICKLPCDLLVYVLADLWERFCLICPLIIQFHYRANLWFWVSLIVLSSELLVSAYFINEQGLVPLLKFLLQYFKNWLSKNCYNTGKALLVTPYVFLVLLWIHFTIYKKIVSVKRDYFIHRNQLEAIGQLLAILDNLQGMAKCGQSCEKLLHGQSIEVDKCLENKDLDFDKKIQALLAFDVQPLQNWKPLCRHYKVIDLFKEFYKNLHRDVNGRTIVPDSKVLLDSFTPMNEKIGEIDLLVSLAELVIKSKGQRTGFAVAEFIHGSKQAIVKGSGVWSVLVDRTKAVPNDVSVGSEKEDGSKTIQGVMVTGGNSTGKSVYIASVATATYLAQSLGIAPAKEFVITPFGRFITQINTVDDPLNNKSLFRAQIRQFGQISAEITKENTDGQLIFTCLDESLSGTKPKYAGPLLAALIKDKLSGVKSFAMLFATHLEHLACKVENLSDGSMIPIQVACNVDSTGHFESSTYQIKPGASEIDSAFKVASEEWIDFMPQNEVESLLTTAKAQFVSF